MCKLRKVKEFHCCFPAEILRKGHFPNNPKARNGKACFLKISQKESSVSFKHPRLSAPVRGQMLAGVLVTEKYGQIFTGELKVCNEDIVIISGELLYIEIISQISLQGSPVCSRCFTCEAFCTGEIHSLSGGTDFAQIFSPGEITGVECTGALRRGCL